MSGTSTTTFASLERREVGSTPRSAPITMPQWPNATPSAWIVPGYEDSQGVFAHLNPAIACNDGTYYTVDITKVGTRTSACVDGSE